MTVRLALQYTITPVAHAALARVRELKEELAKVCDDFVRVRAYFYMRIDGWEETHALLLVRRGCLSNFAITRGVTSNPNEVARREVKFTSDSDEAIILLFPWYWSLPFERATGCLGRDT